MGCQKIEHFILASASPRRIELLSELGWYFTVMPSTSDEVILCGERPEDTACRLADMKASDIVAKRPGEWVVGADTLVALGDTALGKPKDVSDAISMVGMLQGRTHRVITAVAVISPKGEKRVDYETTHVTFRPLSNEDTSAYVALGESLDKAGAYAIQGRGMLLVEKIDGCYFNVVGLPVQKLSAILTELGLPLREQWRMCK